MITVIKIVLRKPITVVSVVIVGGLARTLEILKSIARVRTRMSFMFL